MANGQQLTRPEGCRFTFLLPPDKEGLQWRWLGQPVVNKTTNTWESAFEVGTPAWVAKLEAEKKKSTAPGVVAMRSSDVLTTQWSSGYMRVFWLDVVNIEVTWSLASYSWYWDGSCVYLGSGAYNDWWRSETGCFFGDRWNIGYVDDGGSCLLQRLYGEHLCG